MICPRDCLRIADSMLFLNSYSGTESGGFQQAWRESLSVGMLHHAGSNKVVVLCHGFVACKVHGLVII
jgi:hypothetical protein